MSEVGRRNFLVALGLAPVAAIGAETMVIQREEPELKAVGPDCIDRSSMSQALRNLADLIEKDQIQLASFDVHSLLKPGTLMIHTLHMELLFKA